MSCTSLLYCQRNAFTFYSVNEGLAQSTVMDLYKDPSGLLWAGTGEGLSLWNGHSFRNIQYRYDNPNGLSNNTVRSFLPDARRKCVWIGTESGLDCFNESGTTLINKFVFPEWLANTHIPLFSNDSAVWVFISGKGIYRLNLSTKKYILIRKDVLHAFNKMIPGTDLLCYENNLGKWVRLHLLTGICETENLPGQEPGIIFSGMLPWKNGYLLTSSKGMWSVDKNATNFREVRLPSSSFNSSEANFLCLAKDSTDRLWFSVFGKGIYTCDESLGQLRPQHWQQNGENIANRLLSVRKIICDAYNVIWMATDGEGLIRYTGNRLFFGDQFKESLVTDSAQWFIRTFYSEGKEMWIGTYNSGLKHLNYSTGKITGYSSPLFHSIHCIAKGKKEGILIGTEHTLYDFTNEKFIPYSVDPKISTGLIFHNILRLRDGRCVAATSQYLLLVDESEKKLVAVDDTCANLSGMIQLADGRVLCAAAYRGLYFYNSQLKLVRQIFYPSLGLPVATTISEFIPDDNGGMWAASNIGLLHFDSAFQLKEVFTDKNGLPGSMLYSLLKLPSGELFVTTGNGVSIMNPQTKSFRNFNTSDGLRSNECNTRALCFSADGYLYIGSINGFVRKRFPFEEKRLSPILFRENFAVNGELNNNTTFPDDLPYHKNSLSFNLHPADFAFSESGSWSYYIEGLDTHLVSIPFGIQFRLTSLMPGKYKIHIFHPGNFQQEAASIAFTIHPPWWQETGFRVLFIMGLIAIAAAIVYFIISYRYKIKLRRLESLRLIEKVRTRISSDIHDDLGAGLTRIALTSDLISMQLKSDVTLSKKVGHMAVVARDLSQSLKEVVWSVKPEYDQLDSMVMYFKAYCGELFEDSSIAFSFKVNGVLPSIAVSPETRRNLFLVLKEACNNAMKHSAATKIETTFEYKNGAILLEINDNGRGMPENYQCGINSSGMKNMEKRTTDIGFHFKVSKNNSGGCSVSVSGILAAG